jgi:flagellar biosynthetic protein FliS
MPSPPSPQPIDPTPAPEIPEHIVVLLLEAAQRFIDRLQEVLGEEDPGQRAHFIHKIDAILDELHRRLNHEQGGELVGNLVRMYAWWRQEVLAASLQGNAERLQQVHAQMGGIRQAWEQVLFKGEGMSGNAEF